MGKLFDGICYEEVYSAATQACGSKYPQNSFNSDGSRVSWSCLSVQFPGNYTIERKHYPISGSVTTSYQSQPAIFPECEYGQLTYEAEVRVQNSLELFYLFLGILALIWASKRLYHIFNNYRSE